MRARMGIEQSCQSGSDLEKWGGLAENNLVCGVSAALAVPFHLAQNEFLEKAVEVYLKETEITATAQWRAIMVAQFMFTELIDRGNC